MEVLGACQEIFSTRMFRVTEADEWEMRQLVDTLESRRALTPCVAQDRAQEHPPYR